MWEIRKLYVARWRNSGILYIGESEHRAQSHRVNHEMASTVVEEWMCAVRFSGSTPEVVPLAKCEPEDREIMVGAVIDVAPTACADPVSF